MIDIHVLTHSGTSPEWLAQCLSSLDSQPCTVHVVPGVEGSVGAGRAAGYSLGHHDYVAYVDSDDYLTPGTVAACIQAMEESRAVVTMEYVVNSCGEREPGLRGGHALAVYRRGDVAPYLAAIAQAHHSADIWLRRVLRPLQIAHVGYVWRIHPGGNHHKVTDATIDAEGEAFRTILRQRFKVKSR